MFQAANSFRRLELEKVLADDHQVEEPETPENIRLHALGTSSAALEEHPTPRVDLSVRPGGSPIWLSRTKRLCRQPSFLQAMRMLVPLLVALAVVSFADLVPGKPEVTRMALVVCLMAGWWVTEAVPFAVTSLVPVVLLPTLGILDKEDTTAAYMNDSIFLFIASFLMAAALERWNVHRRLALWMLLTVGTEPRRLLLGFIGASAFLSMWLSNTASCAMMVPLVLALMEEMNGRLMDPDIPVGTAEAAQRLALSRQFTAGLIQAVAYACSIGGMATLTGTGPNLVLAAIWVELYPEREPISFVRWMALGVPFAVVFVLFLWVLFSWLCCRNGASRVIRETLTSDMLQREYALLGPLTWAEQIVILDVVLTVALLVTKKPVGFKGWSELFSLPVGDGATMLTCCILLFFVPSTPPWGKGHPQHHQQLRTQPEVVATTESVDGTETVDPSRDLPLGLESVGQMHVEQTNVQRGVYGMPSRSSSHFVLEGPVIASLNWEIIVLVGGGFAMTRGASASGLSTWLGERIAMQVESMPRGLLVGLIATVVAFLTEITSNTATSNVMLGILAETAEALGEPPLKLMIAATLACSFSFMLPVATPPNAIAFGTGIVRLSDLIARGLVMNLVGILLVMALLPALGPALFF